MQILHATRRCILVIMSGSLSLPRSVQEARGQHDGGQRRGRHRRGRRRWRCRAPGVHRGDALPHAGGAHQGHRGAAASAVGAVASTGACARSGQDMCHVLVPSKVGNRVVNACCPCGSCGATPSSPARVLVPLAARTALAGPWMLAACDPTTICVLTLHFPASVR